ncbi:hypothetical protein DPEC_G00124710 [Dallia pectoralis]|uniref:Uncharacterized protein n=1 Tax=Dallia pectoralis TaxID=75939 RepID=A0ACC2GRK9_DALPE|nr:hypothetical protein DPEC_G00124710 [Dallia pectoralis]
MHRAPVGFVTKDVRERHLKPVKKRESQGLGSGARDHIRPVRLHPLVPRPCICGTRRLFVPLLPMLVVFQAAPINFELRRLSLNIHHPGPSMEGRGLLAITRGPSHGGTGAPIKQTAPPHPH